MKKFFALLFLVFLPVSAICAENPMFAEGTKNSLSFYAAQGTGSGSLSRLVDPVNWQFEPENLFMIEYSQPVKIFRLASRINLSATQNVGYESARGLSFFAGGISWDVALLQWHGFYLGVGIGPYMRNKRDRHVSSRLVFGERVFIGKNISKKWRTEILTQHFSNGDFSEHNHGFNFAGLAIRYSF